MTENGKENRVRELFGQWKIQVQRRRNMERLGRVDDNFVFEIEDLERQIWGLGYGINEDDKLVAI